MSTPPAGPGPGLPDQVAWPASADELGQTIWTPGQTEPLNNQVRSPGAGLSLTPRTKAMVLSGFIAFLLLLVMVSLPVPYILETPGPTIDTLGEHEGIVLVGVPEAPSHPITGQLRFTTVSVFGGKLGTLPLRHAITGWFSTQEALLPYWAIYPPEETAEQREEQSRRAMDSSQQLAAAAALTELGYELVRRQVAGVVVGGPSDGLIELSDVVTSLEGEPVANVEELIDRLALIPPGSTVTVGLVRGGQAITAPVVTGDDGAGGSRLGIEVGYEIPIPITFGIEGIGGPSAGMMLALAIIDKLGPTDLTGGHIVAGTGEIDGAGQVGRIGGIRQKLSGAQRDQAEYFLAPVGNCDEVVGYIPAGLSVFAVGTLSDSLAALAAIRAGDTSQLPTCD